MKAVTGKDFHKTFGARALPRIKLILAELRLQHATEYDARSFGGKVSESRWPDKRYAVKLTRTIGETARRWHLCAHGNEATPTKKFTPWD